MKTCKAELLLTSRDPKLLLQAQYKIEGYDDLLNSLKRALEVLLLTYLTPQNLVNMPEEDRAAAINSIVSSLHMIEDQQGFPNFASHMSTVGHNVKEDEDA